MSEEFKERMISSYDRVHNSRYWQEVSQILSQHLVEQPVVMDIGCGPGLLLRDLTKKYLPKKVIGVDLSPIMLNHAKSELNDVIATLKDEDRIADGGAIEISLIEQHLQDNPLLPINVDYIFSSRVLRSFENQESIMESIYSSLNEGGIFVLLDWTKNSIDEYAAWLENEDNDFDPNMTKWNIVNYHRNFSRYDLDDWEFILRTAKFNILHRFQLDSVHSCIIAQKP